MLAFVTGRYGARGDDLGLEHARALQGICNQAAVFCALEKPACLRGVGACGHGKYGEGGEARELRHLTDTLEHTFHTTLEVQPFEFRRAAYGAKRKNEAVSERGAQERFG